MVHFLLRLVTKIGWQKSSNWAKILNFQTHLRNLHKTKRSESNVRMFVYLLLLLLWMRHSGTRAQRLPRVSPTPPWLWRPQAPPSFSTLSLARPSSWSRSGRTCCTSREVRKRPRKTGASQQPEKVFLRTTIRLFAEYLRSDGRSLDLSTTWNSFLFVCLIVFYVRQSDFLQCI